MNTWYVLLTIEKKCGWFNWVYIIQCQTQEKAAELALEAYRADPRSVVQEPKMYVEQLNQALPSKAVWLESYEEHGK